MKVFQTQVTQNVWHMEGGNKCFTHLSGQKAYSHVYTYICICACISGFCPGLLECRQPFFFVCNKGKNVNCGAGCPTCKIGWGNIVLFQRWQVKTGKYTTLLMYIPSWQKLWWLLLCPSLKKFISVSVEVC